MSMREPFTAESEREPLPSCSWCEDEIPDLAVGGVFRHRKLVFRGLGKDAGLLKVTLDPNIYLGGTLKIRPGASLAQASAACKATDEYVQDNPWRSVGIVAAVAAVGGLLAGLLISRR